MHTKELDEILSKEIKNENKNLILYNDDVNTFNHVIKCLEIYCSHNAMQAEQCAMIVHNKGKCSIKEGSIFNLIPIQTELLMNKLDVKIE
jgi:ATP-dependent Clp protease adaptor protein ClpS